MTDDVEAQAAANAARIAVVCGSEQVDYGALVCRIDDYARVLVQRGAHDRPVLVLADHSPDLIAAVLALFKVGARFTPLHPGWSDQRVGDISRRTAAPLALVDNAHRDRLSDCLSESAIEFVELNRIPPRSAQLPPLPSTPSERAYIYFTSGSTGEPKGVVGSHAGLRRFLDWERARFMPDPGRRSSLLTATTFDPFLRDLLLPLIAGGTLCIPEDAQLTLDAEALAFWLDRERVALTHMVPTLFRELLRAAPHGQLDQLQTVLLAGEPLRGTDVARARELLPANTELVNLYGPTETTLATCFHLVSQGDAHATAVPIGKPIPGSEIAIVGASGERCPDGVSGELVIITDHGSHGYFDDPRATAAVFDRSRPDGLLRYRTGDLGRRRKDGLFVCEGRLDNQVKVRGIKVDLAETERALCELGTVRDAVVSAIPGADGTTLAAFVSTDLTDATEMRQSLLGRLAPHALPTRWQLQAQLPTLPNGKVDRLLLHERATQLPRHPSAPKPADSETATDPVRRLRALWCEVLELDAVGEDDNFAVLGGHSLLAGRLARRIRDVFAVDAKPIDVLRHSTISEQARWLECAPAQTAQPEPEPDPDQPVPPTQRQLDIYLASRFATDPCTYNMPWAVRVGGMREHAPLARAITALAQHHPSLRTVLDMSRARPVQRVLPASSVTIDLLDRSGEAVAPEAIAADLVRPFDLDHEPPFRAAIVVLGPCDHLLFWDVHHIAADGVSEQIMRTTLNDLLRGVQPAHESLTMRALGAAQASAPPPLSDFSEIFDGLPQLDLSAERRRGSRQSNRGATLAFSWPGDPTLPGSQLTGFEYVTTAFALALSLHSGQDDLVIGLVEAGRADERCDRTVGMLMNTIPARLRFPAHATVRETLADVSATTRRSIARGPVPAALLDGNVPRNPGRNPIFDALVIFQNHDEIGLELAGCEIEAIPLERATAKYDVSLYAVPRADGIDFALEYCSDLFDERFATRLKLTISSLLDRLATALDTRLAALEPAPADRQPGDTHARLQPPRQDFVHRALARTAAADPDRVALCHGTDRITYGQLDRRANAIAAAILAHPDYRPGQTVGVLVARNPDLIATIFGVLKAGGSYLPLDPGHPHARLSRIVDHSRCRLLVTDREIDLGVARLPSSEIARSSNADPELPVGPEDPIYVIYTSGSTGTPKGVVLTHANIANFIAAIGRVLELGRDSRICCLTTVSFDIFVLETLMPLATGASLALADETEQLDLVALSALLGRHRANVLQTTPSRLAAFLDHHAAERLLAGIEVFVIGGEAIRADAVRRLLRFPSRPRLYNVYGPTETAVWSTAKRITDADDLTLGRAILNNRLHVMDGAGRPRPLGSLGELWIGGAGVAAGYLHADELTARAFVADPQHPSERAFRTGDIVRWNAAGELEFFGRRDHQVKVRGYRIELTEIEDCLTAVPGVARCVCATGPDPATDTAQIIAFYTLSAEVTTATLRAAVRAQLPDYYLPQRFLRVAEIPLTPSGKVDRKALLAIAARDEPDVATERAAETSDSLDLDGASAPVQLVSGAWAQALGHDRFSGDDNFFEVGGTSLSLVGLYNILERSHPGVVDLATIFARPTVALMAELFAAADARLHPAAPIAIGRGVDLLRATGYRPLELTAGRPRSDRALVRAGGALAVSPDELLLAAYVYLLGRLSRRPRFTWYLADRAPGNGVAYRAVDCDLAKLKDSGALLRFAATVAEHEGRTPARRYQQPAPSVRALTAAAQLRSHADAGYAADGGFDLVLRLPAGENNGAPSLRINELRLEPALGARIADLYRSVTDELVNLGLESTHEESRGALRRSGVAVRDHGKAAV